MYLREVSLARAAQLRLWASQNSVEIANVLRTVPPGQVCDWLKDEMIMSGGLGCKAPEKRRAQ